MAMRTQVFADDRVAKRLFKVHVDTAVRRDWLDGGVVRGKPFEARFERLARHEREMRRAAAAARITDVERLTRAATAKAAALRQKRLEQSARKAVRFRAHHLCPPCRAGDEQWARSGAVHGDRRSSRGRARQRVDTSSLRHACVLSLVL